jgi:hypothetical protein
MDQHFFVFGPNDAYISKSPSGLRQYAHKISRVIPETDIDLVAILHPHC